MPEPVGELEEPHAVVCRHDVAVFIEVREISHAGAEPLLVAAADVARRAVSLQLAKMPRKGELLVIGDALVAKHQHGVAVHPSFDRGDLVRSEEHTSEL